MIAFLKGTVEHIGPDFADIDVAGVGYRVFTALSTLERMPNQGKGVKLFTTLVVREDSLSLYGFLTERELEIFQKLITVSGVGPKAALALLSTMSPSAFCNALAEGDVDQLVKVPGIGKKTAQRIVLELKDKLKGITVEGCGRDLPQNKKEAMEALISLGFDASGVKKVLAQVEDGYGDTAQLIKFCLKRLKS